MKINGKTIVITGGASGLGAATASYLVTEKGARVALFDLKADEGHALAETLGADKAFFQTVDVTDAASVQAAVDATTERFGTIHVCINCAGVPMPAKILDREGKAMALEKFKTVIDINLVGSFNVMSKCAEQMAKNPPENEEERGVVINVSSGAAYEGQIGQAAYGSSKAGVIGLNMPAARELGRLGIRVNAIAPGLFRTPMLESLGDKAIASLTQMVEAPKRMGDMREFAHLCAFMIENAYLNGETIRLDAASRMQAK
ncbi:MAG: SDR family NAD(P)-dependent oxidoreductase [Pseudomonadota bacterium]